MSCWLLKAEPDSRLINGHDVAFSVDTFERIGTTSWEGVRSHEAKKILKERMKVGERCLFYASNTKIPGVAATAIISREGYPDHNAWDAAHPYYDLKSKADSPTWYMVDLDFVARLPHFVPLKLLQTLALLPSPPACTPYLTQPQLDGIKSMALLNRGRLSVQPVADEVYEAVVELGTKGGWEELLVKEKKVRKEKVIKDKAVKEITAQELEEGGQPKPALKRKKESAEPAAKREGTRSSKRMKS